MTRPLSSGEFRFAVDGRQMTLTDKPAKPRHGSLHPDCVITIPVDRQTVRHTNAFRRLAFESSALLHKAPQIFRALRILFENVVHNYVAIAGIRRWAAIWPYTRKSHSLAPLRYDQTGLSDQARIVSRINNILVFGSITVMVIRNEMMISLELAVVHEGLL